MERTITIDGKEVRFRASAGIPRLYRLKFRRDILVDMRAIAKAVEKERERARENAAEGEADPEESHIPMEALTLFEEVAYIMAKHADKDNVPNTVEEWLDGFGTFSIYQVFPVIEELWEANLKQLNTPQKK